jgi:hypothetical protein
MIACPLRNGPAVATDWFMENRGPYPETYRIERRDRLSSMNRRDTGITVGTWERIKLALLRDWNQTKFDLGIDGGEELHQDLSATVKQAVGSEPPPKESFGKI